MRSLLLSFVESASSITVLLCLLADGLFCREELMISDLREQNSENSNYPTHLWMYYDGEIHPIIRQMINRTLTTTKQNWNIHFLTGDNVSIYIDRTLLPDKFHLYSCQNQADLLRLILLNKYGGWWMDATTIVNSDGFMLDARDELMKTEADFFGYCWLQCPKTLIENNVMYAKKKSAFISGWESEYKKALALGREEYIYTRYRNGIDFASQLFLKYPQVNVYFTAYAAQRVALTRIIPRSTRIRTIPAEDYIYKLMVSCDWNAKCLANILPYELQGGQFPITKIPSLNRRQVWPGTGAPSRRKSIEPIYKATGLAVKTRSSMLASLWLFVQGSFVCLIYSYAFHGIPSQKKYRKDTRLLL